MLICKRAPLPCHGRRAGYNSASAFCVSGALCGTFGTERAISPGFRLFGLGCFRLWYFSHWEDTITRGDSRGVLDGVTNTAEMPPPLVNFPFSSFNFLSHKVLLFCLIECQSGTGEGDTPPRPAPFPGLRLRRHKRPVLPVLPRSGRLFAFHNGDRLPPVGCSSYPARTLPTADRNSRNRYAYKSRAHLLMLRYRAGRLGRPGRMIGCRCNDYLCRATWKENFRPCQFHTHSSQTPGMRWVSGPGQ